MTPQRARRAVLPALLLAAALPLLTGASPPMPDLHQMLMGKFDAMNAKSEGIFHQDVTELVAPYFPVGQPKAETEKIIAEQHLGMLKPFKGTNDPGMGSMFVTRFDLTSHMFSHVYVVLDFDYDEPAMTLKAMKAFLRASTM